MTSKDTTSFVWTIYMLYSITFPEIESWMEAHPYEEQGQVSPTSTLTLNQNYTHTLISTP